MVMPLRALRAIYEVLFRDGVMVAKKDKRPQTMHPEIEGVSNLQVIRAMGSLKSRGCVKETFAWRHFYWYLTNEGIVYLRDYLHLPPEIVPASLQRVRRPAATLAIAHRAAKVQSIEGPTSYVPKPGRRGEVESQEAVAERRSYRHRMMGAGERESESDRTPRFRGRHMEAEPVRRKAPSETEERPQPQGVQSESGLMEDNRVRRVAYQLGNQTRERPATMRTDEWKVADVQKEKASAPAQVQRATFKSEVSQVLLTSLPSKEAQPSLVSTVSEDVTASASKITVVPAPLKAGKEKPQITKGTTSMKSVKVAQATSAVAALSGAGLNEEGAPKQALNTVNAAQLNATVEIKSDNFKSQKAVKTAVAQETSQQMPSSANKMSFGQDVKKENLVKVVVDSVKSAEVKSEKPSDKVKGKDAKVAVKDAFNVPTESVTSVITKPVNEDVKLEKLKIMEVSVKPEEVKSADNAKMDHGKNKERQKDFKLSGHTVSSSTVVTNTSRTEITSVRIIQESKITTMTVEAKPPTDTEKQVLEVDACATASAQAPAKDTNQVNVNLTVTEVKGKKTTHAKVAPQVEGEETVQSTVILQTSVGEATQAPEDSPTQPQQSATDGGLVMETKRASESKSKSKRKKKKSPGEIAATNQAEETADLISPVEKPVVIKPPEVMTENPARAITSETITVGSTHKNLKELPKLERKAMVDGTELKKVSHQITETKVMVAMQTKEQSVSEAAAPKAEPVALAPLVELPDGAKMNEEVRGITVGEMIQPLVTEGKSDVQLVCAEPPAVAKVETVTLQKVCQVELTRAVPKNESTRRAEPLQPQEPAAADKPTKESAKARKKGKGKKQAETAASDNINTQPEADGLPSDNITSLPGAAVNDHLVTAPEPSKVSAPAKTTHERMCSEETGPSAAVLSEARTDKREVESAPLSAEKIEQEVPKPKTSSTVREAHAVRESASVRAAEAAAAAQAQASPLAEQEEPPKVAQLSASQAAEEERLPVLEASKQEEERKKSESEGEDTPSVPVAQAAAKAEPPYPAHTCESASADVDEAAMKKKIVVVEEIVEVKQIVSPPAVEQQSSPPPVQPEEDEEEGALDLDVLDAIAIERSLLSAVPEVELQGTSPDDEWDHSLADPEEKTWPNFVEGLFGHVSVFLLSALRLLALWNGSCKF